MTSGFDLCGMLRRIRRCADLSQRQLAAAAGVSVSAVAHAEAGTRDLPVHALVRVAALAGLRLALLDADGQEVTGMIDAGARDGGYRRLPAHLDTVHSEERWWRYAERYTRPQPTYTFDRDRAGRDARRAQFGTPDDHHVPHPGDSPAEREAARRAEARRRRDEERRRRFESGELRQVGPDFVCSCPPACEELDDRSGKPVHADDCPCGCDVA